jgi:predicted methyltransferase
LTPPQENRRMKPLAAALLAFAALSAGCGPRPANPASEAAGAAPESAEAALAAAIEGPHRTAEERARDQHRHPAETLGFFGFAPDLTVVEVWPGGGWYTNILAPALAKGGGVYYAAGLDPAASDRAREAVAAFEAKYKGDPELYGEVILTVLGDGQEIAPAGSADLVLTFRNVHNWLSAGTAQANFKRFYDALKPGGVLGVVEHRAAPDATAESEKTTGYVRETTVKSLAEAAGFDFDATAEINANPKDTKDHPFGVWTLPPSRRSSAARGVEDPNFDRAKYDAIGESDRMTLKFRKPLAADGALLE